MPNRPVIEILRAHDPLSSAPSLAEGPVSAEREQHGADAHLADGAHDAQHTYPGHRTHEEHGHESGALRNNGHGSDAGHARHGGHGGHGKHAGHNVEMFRRRFWWSLLLTIPVVVTSHMVMDWFGYDARLPGHRVGRPGARLGHVPVGRLAVPRRWLCERLKDRQPGMMLLIAMAITVAYVASMATSLGWFDLDFWWELAALVTIMLLGHWQEMKALGQAQDALAALAALLPDEAERVAGGRHDRDGRRPRSCGSATSCWSAPAAGSPPTA